MIDLVSRACSRVEFAKQYQMFESAICGGMGEVRTARQVALDRLVAVKTITTDLRENPEIARRFVVEARALSRLSHPNVVQIFDFGLVDGQPFLVMELLCGTDLRQAIANRLLDLKETLRIVAAVLAGLQHIHENGMVHRDLKPSNVLLTEDGGVKIVDFGAVRDLAGTSITATGNVVGTPMYMAPEQLLGEAVGPKADLYSAGVILWEMITGGLPRGRAYGPTAFVTVRTSADPLRLIEVAPDAPPGVCEIVDALLRREAERRPPGALAVRRKIENVLASAPPTALARTRFTAVTEALPRPVPVGTVRMAAPSIPPARSSRAGMLGAAALVGLFAIGFVVRPRAEPPRPSPSLALATPPPPARTSPSPVAEGPSLEDALRRLHAFKTGMNVVEFVDSAVHALSGRHTFDARRKLFERMMREHGLWPELKKMAVPWNRILFPRSGPDPLDPDTRRWLLNRFEKLRRIDRTAEIEQLGVETGVDAVLGPQHSARPPDRGASHQEMLIGRLHGTPRVLPPRHLDDEARTMQTVALTLPRGRKFREAKLVALVEGLPPRYYVRIEISGTSGGASEGRKLLLELWGAVDEPRARGLVKLAHALDPRTLPEGGLRLRATLHHIEGRFSVLESAGAALQGRELQEIPTVRLQSLALYLD